MPLLVLPAPYVVPDRTSVWAQYSVLSDRRTALQDILKQEGIPTAIYYPILLHLQMAFQHLGYKPGDFPSEGLAQRIFSLPMSPYLSPEDQERRLSDLAQSCNLGKFLIYFDVME
jgi:UDP-2-acetamido-2-deoxy-ribo-hexuluronate aminotransferase